MNPRGADSHMDGFPNAELRRFPNFVNLEVHRGSCPCRCVHCPVGLTPPAERARRFGLKSIDLDLFQRVASEVGAHPWATLRLHSVGDPILWPELPEALAIARRNAARTWLFTCAVTGDTRLWEKVCGNTDILEISLNSVDRDDYLETKGVDAFENAVANLRRAAAIRQDATSLRLIVSRVASDSPARDADFVAHWQASGLVDDAFVRTYHTYNDILAAPAASCHEPQPCLVHWARFNVNVDGLAVVCFNELFKEKLDERLILGDVNVAPIAALWRGTKLEAIRTAELRGDYTGLSCEPVLPCKTCVSCQPLRGFGETSEHQVEGLAAEHG